MPGVTIRKASVKSWLRDPVRLPWGERVRASLFSVCQAISIAMTRVFPLPVAIFSATRRSSGFASALAFSRSSHIQASPTSGLRATSVR